MNKVTRINYSVICAVYLHQFHYSHPSRADLEYPRGLVRQVCHLCLGNQAFPFYPEKIVMKTQSKTMLCSF
jgi:hypothetical protein